VDGVGRQDFELESVRLGPRSDLHPALAVPYAEGITLVAERSLTEAGPQGAAIRFRDPKTGTPVILSPGGTHGGTELAYVGQRILVLTDGDHWLLQPRP
jgi:hypothetical protein